ncbi:MAG: HEAT repeat domain-containing protein [Melioribacteraceae bacterium]|nr:HEAT repeat domain-containing protein [Melioribacteraceae bacterium]
MKKLIFLILIIIIPYCAHSQTISEKRKNQLLSQIYDTSAISNFVMYEIRDWKLAEALPLLDKYYHKQILPCKIAMIDVFAALGYPKAKQYGLALYDSIMALPQDEFDEHYYFDQFIHLARVLMNINDYSMGDYIVEKGNKFKPWNDAGYQLLLRRMVRNPQYRDWVKIELIRLTKDNNWDSRTYAVEYLYEFFGMEAYPYLIDMMKNDPMDDTRLNLIDELGTINNKETIDFLVERMFEDPRATIRESISKLLLEKYPSPTMYNKMFEYAEFETDTLYEKLAKMFDYFFIITKPDSSVSISVMLDSLSSYTEQCYDFNWLKNYQYKSELTQKIQAARNYLISQDSLNCYKMISSFRLSIKEVYSDSAGSYPRYVSKDAYKFLYYYPKYILERLPSPPTVKLQDSQDQLIPGGSLQYYEGGWKNAIDNGDGTFTLDTKLKTISLRMTYEYGSQTKSNLTVGQDAIIFQTVNTKVKLFSSEGAPLDTGTVQYYAGGWRNFGKTDNGVASKELLAANYSFRMTYAYASIDKAQNLDTNSTVVFTTKNTIVELRNSSGQLIDGGQVQYYSGGWRVFGSAANGTATKELLPNTYSFRMIYAFASNDKSQNIDINSTVVFSTVRANVELRNSLDNLMDQGAVQYYSGGWREFGTTQNGITNKELLPNNYSFRMTYGFASNDKQQNIGINPTVVFQTVSTTVELRNSQNNFMGEGVVQYYSGGWRSLGTTIGGVVSRELLPNSYSFRMTHEYISLDKSQNVGTVKVVTFSTVLCRVVVRDNQNQPINNAAVRYYSGGWRNIGTTTNGEASKELLPGNITFRAIVGTVQQDKTQNLLTNPVVEFTF